MHAMGAELPGVNVDPSWFWCPEHLEPFRARWPLGFIVATMYLLEEAIASEEILRATGGDARRLHPVLMEYGPICCFTIRPGSDLDEEWLADMCERSVAMDPKLRQEIKRRQGERKVARMKAEKSERAARSRVETEKRRRA